MENTKIQNQLRNIGMLTGIENEMYMFTVSSISTVYLERKDGIWHCWRERYSDDKHTEIKLISSNSDFNRVLKDTKKYIKYIKQLRSVTK